MRMGLITYFRTTYHAELAKRETFKQIVDSLKGQRREVFEAILHNYPVTDKEISSITGIPINVIPARRKELQGYRWEYSPADGKGEYVHHPELEYIEFDSYVKDKKECKWRPTDKAIKKEPELNFE